MESLRKDIKDPKDHLIDLIGQQYIGKSKLFFYSNICEDSENPIVSILPQNTLIKDVSYKILSLLTEGKDIKLGYPHVYIPGDLKILKDQRSVFYIGPPTGNFNHYLCITAIDKNLIDIGYCKLLGQLWSSYYEDSHRGYLFQIISKDTFNKMIDWLNTQ